MLISIIISMCDSRQEMFRRSLTTYSKQTIDKKDFEIIVVDDNDRKDIKEICKEFSNNYNINFQYIKIDQTKSFITQKTFTPALTNNVGFKNARGNIVIIVGPETIVKEDILQQSLKIQNKKVCLYGLVYNSNIDFVNNIEKIDIFKTSFDDILKLPGAKNQCLTTPPHPPAYWYFMVANKKHVFDIGGVDEKFLQGICGEDDDFSNRMKMSGVTPMFDHSMLGIHQDHSLLDKSDIHNFRFNKNDWQKFRQINLKIMRENLQNKIIVVNQDHVWGDDSVIVAKDFF